MSFGSETLNGIINNKEALVKWLYERYAKKLLAYTLKPICLMKTMRGALCTKRFTK